MRDIEGSSQSEYDLLVIGAGINGAAIAWDATLRGLRVALVDKGDFGAETSSACFKIVHGGLRYLQHLDLARLMRSAREQYYLRTIAPHLIYPIPFLIPCYGYGKKSKEFLALGVSLYEALTTFKNKNIESEQMMPSFRVVSREECLQLAPGLCPKGLRGGVIYYDCQIYNCERLTYEFVRSAQGRGARVINYCKAKKLQNSLPGYSKVLCEDMLTGAELSLKAKVIVNATGPWAKAFAKQMLDGVSEPAWIYAKGLQCVVPQITNIAVAVEGFGDDEEAPLRRGRQSYFFVPWRGHSLLGTTEESYVGDPNAFQLTRKDLRRFLRECSDAYSSKIFSEEQVKHVFGGLRPVVKPLEAQYLSGEERFEKVLCSRKDELIDHEGKSDTQRNFITVIGVKYTTSRILAEEVVDMVFKKLGKPLVRSSSHVEKLDGGAFQSLSKMKEVIARSAIPKVCAEAALRNYGKHVDMLLSLSRDEPKRQLLHKVSPEHTTLKAEVIYALRHEDVCFAEDVVLRRTDLGTLGHPGVQALSEVVKLIGEEFGWGESKQKEEREKLEQKFIRIEG